ncbi:MAG: hypothetical protein ACREQV_08135 [Candidatus Binatia bacterium]
MQDATRCLRSLTILAHRTGWDLLVQVWPVVLRVARLVASFRRDQSSLIGARVSPEAMFQFETELEGLLREIGRRIVEWTVNRLEPEDRHQMPRLLKWEGEYYRRRSKSPLRNLNCLFGPIALKRFCYQPLESCGRCLFPLEVQLGIVASVATPALADCVGRMAADLTQRQLLDQLRQRGICWGVGTLRKLTQAMAERMSEHRHHAQVEQILTWLQAAARSSGPCRFGLSVGRDGLMMPIKKKETYKEGATATISVLDRRGRRIGTVYLGQMPEAGQGTLSRQLTALLTDVLRQWDGPLPRLTYVTDCGSHPTEYFQQVLAWMPNPRRPQELLEWEWVVDYYHACLYITKLAEAIFGPGRQAFTWAAKQRKVLKQKNGGIYRVLRSAGALRTIRGLVGSEENYWSAYNFLRSRTAKMDYAAYKRLRMPIGSGVTEAACKVVFTQRFKQSGMKWTIDGGQQILALRVIALSRIWDRVRQATLQSAIMPQVPTPQCSTHETDEIPAKSAA